MKSAETNFACVLCARPALKTYFVIREQRFYRCPVCQLIQMRPLSMPGAGDDYARLDLDRYHQFVRLFWVPWYRKALGLVKRFKKAGRLLDIGCGTGGFLEQARDFGFEVMGIEPSATAAGLAGRRHHVIRAELLEAELPAGSFDVVTLWSVLEHISRPTAFLARVHSILNEDGILALRIPSSDGLLPLLSYWVYRASAGRINYPLRVIYQLEWHYKHFFYYNADNVERLLRKCGFKPLILEREDSYDIPSLEFRLDYLPRERFPRAALKTALLTVLGLSRWLGRQDELVIVARRSAPDAHAAWL